MAPYRPVAGPLRLWLGVLALDARRGGVGPAGPCDMGARIIHPHVPTHRPAEQAPCWEALAAAEEAGWPVEHVELSPADPLAYGAALAARWDGPGDWLIVEHDVAPSVELVAEMMACERLTCFAGYGPAVESVAATLGCTRITERARRRTGAWPVPPGITWHVLDAWLTSGITSALGLRELWHPHGPVAHYHGVGTQSHMI